MTNDTNYGYFDVLNYRPIISWSLKCESHNYTKERVLNDFQQLVDDKTLDEHDQTFQVYLSLKWITYVLSALYSLLQVWLSACILRKDSARGWRVMTIRVSQILLTLLLSIVGITLTLRYKNRLIDLCQQIEGVSYAKQCGTNPLSIIPFSEVTQAVLLTDRFS